MAEHEQRRVISPDTAVVKPPQSRLKADQARVLQPRLPVTLRVVVL